MKNKENRISRRSFLKTTAFAGTAATTLPAAEIVRLPFENGERPLVAYPQKRPLIRLTSRPPQLETPFELFNESAMTPNDAFFVRYHLTNSPPSEEQLAPEKFHLAIQGLVKEPL